MLSFISLFFAALSKNVVRQDLTPLSMRNPIMLLFAHCCAFITCDGPIVGEADTAFRGVPAALKIVILVGKMPF